MGTLIALDKDLIWVNGGSGPTPPEPDIPDGTTAIPINDVVIWQKCAGLTQQYDTLAEVLADSGIIRTLMNSKNAVDYLVRSKQFIKSEALVPTMTSNNTPSGACSANAEYSNSYQAYKAFDNDSTTYWFPATVTGTNPNTGWIQYDFGTTKVCRAAKVKASSGNDIWTSVIVSGSNDNSNFTPLYESTEPISALNPSEHVFTFSNNTAYRYYRLTITSYRNGGTTGNYSEPIISEIQLYSIAEGVTDNAIAMTYIGANDYAANTLLADSDWCSAIQNSTYYESVLNVKVPTMTSNTTPSGVASYGNAGRGHEGEPYYAFDRNSSTAFYECATYGAGTKPWIQYAFESSYAFYKARISIRSEGSDNRNHSLNFNGSNNGSDFTILSTKSLLATGGTPTTYDVALDNNGNTYSILRVEDNGQYSSPYFHEIQFYGRQNGGVQSWLTAGGVTDKNYTTLSQILSDPVTLQTLMQSENAVNYLVTCKMWIDEICSNENAMTYIGYSNYASNTLLADETWCEAICLSTYRENVLNVKVPEMTSATTPSGTVSASSNLSSYYPYIAFSDTPSPANRDNWYPNVTSTSIVGQWIQYVFANPVKIYCVYLLQESYYTTWTYSNGSQSMRADGSYYVVSNNAATDTYRLTCSAVESPSSSSYAGLHRIQFYGRVDI